MPSKLKNGEKRSRGVPVQVYVSDAEALALERLCERRGITVSGLVRVWIRRATSAHGAKPGSGARARDPRQLDLC